MVSSTITLSTTYQTITGFGANAAFGRPGAYGRTLEFGTEPESVLQTDQADLFFSSTSGIGLSILRAKITPYGSGAYIAPTQDVIVQAHNRGAKISLCAWTPGTEYKDPNNKLWGGSFVGNASNYAGYAAKLAHAVEECMDLGITPYAISVQNEPNWVSSAYDTCSWTAQQIHDFVPYLRDELDAVEAEAVKIAVDDYTDWPGDGYRSVVLADADVLAQVGVLAIHNYDQGAASAKTKYSKELWMNEWTTYDAYDPSITNALTTASKVHDFLTVANVEVWNYWWLANICEHNESAGDMDNEGLTRFHNSIGSQPAVAKRLYAFGNYSKFVRPGYVRVAATSDDSNVLISAYKSGLTNVVVAANKNGTSTSTTFTITGSNIAEMTPYVTSASASLAAQSAVAVTNGSWNYSLPASSVTTFTGTGTETGVPDPPENFRIVT